MAEVKAAVTKKRTPLTTFAQDHALAYMVLYTQEHAKRPGLTPVQFSTWLHASHGVNVKAAKAQHEAATAAKGKN